MSGDILVISSSPEPEGYVATRRNKGKSRATDDFLDLTTESQDAELLNLDTNLVASGSGRDGGDHVDGTPRDALLAAHEAHASGSEAQPEEPQVSDDPVERTIRQVLNVIPNVDPEHLRTLVLSYESQNEGFDMGTAIISQLLENPDYPKVELLKRKSSQAQGRGSPAKRPKVDYLSKDRPAPTDIAYMNNTMDQLVRIDFPQIPKDYIKKAYFKNSSLYASTYLALRNDLEDGSKFIVKKTSARSETSRSKRKALAESKEFEDERKWLLQYLEEEQIRKAEEAELAECEQNGTGLECGCCFGDFPFSWMVQCPDAHLFCRDCARRSAEECIGNRKINLTCMDQSGCKLAFAESEVQRFLPEKSLELWHRIKQELEIELAQIDGLESCPFCSYAVVIENEQERLFRCENVRCGIVSCRECKKEDHLPKTCKEMEQDKVLDARHAVEEAMTKALMRNCPKCSQSFVKDFGCNKMICPKCKSLSCYVCRQVIKGYDHFDQTPAHAQKPNQGSSSKCPLWDSVDQRHADEVKKAAQAAQEEYRRLHPEIEKKDIEVELPLAPAPPPRPPLIAQLPALPVHHLHQGFGLGAMPQLLQRNQAHIQQAQQMAHQAGALLAQQQGRYYGGMIDPARAYQELQANRAAERRRAREAALQREQDRAAARRVVRQAALARHARARVAMNPPPAALAPPAAAVPVPRRNPHRQ